MANEAYLYSAERPDVWKASESDYHTSRWVIPLAWFFLFRVKDIALPDVTCYDGTTSWKEVRLQAEKGVAFELFADRRPLLSALIAGRIGESDIDSFLETIRRRPGRYLIMDPSSVFGDDDSDAPFFTSVLEAVDKEDVPALTGLDKAGSVVGGFRNGPGRYLEDVLGYYVPYDAGSVAVNGPDEFPGDVSGFDVRIDTSEL